MNLTCIENNLSIANYIDVDNVKFNVFVSNKLGEIHNFPSCDYYLIDASFDMIELGEILELKYYQNTGSKYLVVYENFSQLEKLLAKKSYPDISFISIADLKTGRYKFEDSSENVDIDNCYKNNFMQSLSGSVNSQDGLSWILLQKNIDNLFENKINYSDLVDWVTEFLDCSRVLFLKLNKHHFNYESSKGVQRSSFCNLSLSIDSKLVEYLSQSQSCISLPDTVSGIKSIPSYLHKDLVCMKMNAAVLINENRAEKFILFFSKKETGQLYDWGQIKTVKSIFEYMFDRLNLNKASLDVAEKTSYEPGFESAVPEYFYNFSSRISNDFKNALVSIKTFTQLLPEKYKDASFRKDFFNIITHEVSRIEDLMNVVSFFSDKYEPELSDNFVKELIKKSLNYAKDKYAKLKIKSSFNFQDFEIRCELKALSQAVSVFLINSFESMNCEGTVFIDVKQSNIKRYDSNLIITIKDSGKGISKEEYEKMFDPFFSTKPKGLGLSLTFAKVIIQAHGGEILVNPAVKEGSEIKLILPASSAIIENKTINTLLENTN